MTGPKFKAFKVWALKGKLPAAGLARAAELKKNLRSALKEALEFNREDALAAAQQDDQEEAIVL